MNWNRQKEDWSFFFYLTWQAINWDNRTQTSNSREKLHDPSKYIFFHFKWQPKVKDIAVFITVDKTNKYFYRSVEKYILLDNLYYLRGMLQKIIILTCFLSNLINTIIWIWIDTALRPIAKLAVASIDP